MLFSSEYEFSVFCKSSHFPKNFHFTQCYRNVVVTGEPGSSRSEAQFPVGVTFGQRWKYSPVSLMKALWLVVSWQKLEADWPSSLGCN